MLTRRRACAVLLAALCRSGIAGAQESAVRRIGFLEGTPRTAVTDSFWKALVSGLQDAGWVENRNLVIERRYAEARKEAARARIEELLGTRVAVIVVSTTPAALAAKEATSTVPIVMTVPADPVALGLVNSLARPGGNLTGLSFLGTEVAGKQVELLKEAVGTLNTVAVLVNPANASHPPRVSEITTIARIQRMRVEVVAAASRADLASSFRTMTRRGAEAAIVLADSLFVREMSGIVGLAAEQRLPTMYGVRAAPLAGGLMSYGPSFTDLFRRAAGYVDRILRGASPKDLPIEQASRFELVINLKAAGSLGITMPQSLLVRADEVVGR
jgi:putative ABC transport system substrate-binding protein